MGWGGPGFVIAIIAICTAGWAFTTWIRVKHGYPVENEWGGMTHKPDDLAAKRQVEILSNENADLKGKIGRLEERLSVLERIATDPAERTAREIENLR